MRITLATTYNWGMILVSFTSCFLCSARCLHFPVIHHNEGGGFNVPLQPVHLCLILTIIIPIVVLDQFRTLCTIYTVLNSLKIYIKMTGPNHFHLFRRNWLSYEIQEIWYRVQRQLLGMIILDIFCHKGGQPGGANLTPPSPFAREYKEHTWTTQINATQGSSELYHSYVLE